MLSFKQKNAYAYNFVFVGCWKQPWAVFEELLALKRKLVLVAKIHIFSEKKSKVTV